MTKRLIIKLQAGGEVVKLEVEKDASIHDVLRQIWSISGMPPKQQQLSYLGALLHPEELLSDHKITDMATLFLSFTEKQEDVLKKVQQFPSLDDIQLWYNSQVLDDHAPLTKYKIGYKKITYVFVKLAPQLKHGQPKPAQSMKPVPFEEYASIQDSFDVECRSFDFQKQVIRAEKSLAERSSLGMSRLDSYHDIKALKKEIVARDVLAATKYTKDILSSKPSGDLNMDTLTAAHVINNLFRSNNEEIVIYDSRKGMALQDSSSSVDDLFLRDKPMVLRLKDLEGLGVPSRYTKPKPNGKLLAEIQAAIETNTQHPILEDVRSRLAQCFEIEKARIRFTEVFRGSACFQYTVDHLASREKERIIQQDTSGRLASNFDQFQDLKLHPLLFRPAFDLAMFDKRGDKNFENMGSTFQVGPEGNKKTYTQPKGWVRYGLKVLTGNALSDRWLHPFQDPGNWWRAFHGTANAGNYMAGVDPRNPVSMQAAAMEAVGSIHKNGFEMAHITAYGPGVYCSPNPEWMDRHDHVAKVSIDVANQSQPKKFCVMLQVGVRPGADTLQPQSTDNKWAVKNSDHIRAYGILIREEANVQQGHGASAVNVGAAGAAAATTSPNNSCLIQ